MHTILQFLKTDFLDIPSRVYCHLPQRESHILKAVLFFSNFLPQVPFQAQQEGIQAAVAVGCTTWLREKHSEVMKVKSTSHKLFLFVSHLMPLLLLAFSFLKCPETK